MPRRKDDFESNYLAMRRRLQSLGTAVVPAPVTIPPHTHHASEIIAEPEETTALLSADDVQEALEELGGEKLARSGEQPMLGDLDMNHNDILQVTNVWLEENVECSGVAGTAKVNGLRELNFKDDAAGEANINDVRDILFAGDVGEGVIDGPRVVHFIGDDDDNEALIDGLERVVFNNEPTKSLVQWLSRIEWNRTVEPDSSFPLTGAAGTQSWALLERALQVIVQSGNVEAAIVNGWGVKMCIAEGGV